MLAENIIFSSSFKKNKIISFTRTKRCLLVVNTVRLVLENGFFLPKTEESLPVGRRPYDSVAK